MTTAADLVVVIPTRQRWGILARTLDALGRQTADGFHTTVVVDGKDQRVPELPGVDVLVVDHAGPGAARNAGARASERPLVLFLGDDMVPAPDLVERHLDGHRRHPDPVVAVLGHASWHPEVADGPMQQWLERSGHQFDYRSINGREAGFGHFYSCNVSLKRDFFLGAGGFDEEFVYYYEDLDCGWRLAEHGMRLRYEPAARTFHLHSYDRAGLARRMRGVAEGEWCMARKHPWFTPWFLEQFRGVEPRRADRLWRLAATLPTVAPRGARVRADRAELAGFAPAFLEGWTAAAELDELRAYLGDTFDQERLWGHAREVDEEHRLAPDDASFYRTSRSYLYDLTAFAMTATKAPYLGEIRRQVGPGGRLLDYGCGIGSDGLRLMAGGYRVSFADYANPSTRYLQWRLARRAWEAPVYDVEGDEVPAGFDLVYSFDVIEHVEDPFAFLDRLERLAPVVMVNLLEEEPEDTELHRPLPVTAILDRAERLGLLRYRLYHGRSHLLTYRSPAPRPGPRLRSVLERRAGRRLPGSRPWFPVAV